MPRGLKESGPSSADAETSHPTLGSTSGWLTTWGSIASVVSLLVGVIGVAVTYGTQEWYLQVLNACLILILGFVIYSYRRKDTGFIRAMAMIKDAKEEAAKERAGRLRSEEEATRAGDRFAQIARLIEAISGERARITAHLFAIPAARESVQ